MTGLTNAISFSPLRAGGEFDFQPMLTNILPPWRRGLSEPKKEDLAQTDAWRTIATLMAERTAATQERDLARAETEARLREHMSDIAHIRDLMLEVHSLKQRLAHWPESPAPDYHGPVVDGQPAPDETHERFYESVKDVLAGRVMPQAREQMRDALGRAPEPAKPKTLPKGAITTQRQNIGLRLP